MVNSMKTSKKTSSKSVSIKAQKVFKSDAMKSVAIASLLLNSLFLISIVVITRTNTFDHRVYSAAKNRYCANIEGVSERAQELGSEKAAIEEYQVNCVGKDFQPFYNEALQKYQAQVN